MVFPIHAELRCTVIHTSDDLKTFTNLLFLQKAWNVSVLFNYTARCRKPGNSKLHTGCADKSLARLGRKQAQKHVSDARDFNNIETQAVKFFFCKAPTEINAILTEILACFLPGRAKDLSASLYKKVYRQEGELIPEYKSYIFRM